MACVDYAHALYYEQNQCLLMNLWYTSLQLLDICCCRGFASAYVRLVMCLPFSSFGLWSTVSFYSISWSTTICSWWNRYWMVLATVVFLLFLPFWCLCRWASRVCGWNSFIPPGALLLGRQPGCLAWWLANVAMCWCSCKHPCELCA
jgi:hypothetical protein